MKILKIIGLVVLGLIVIGAIWIFTLPSDVHMERSITVNKDVATVYANVSTIKNFNNWSPWASIDPEGTTYEYEGPDSGVGARVNWSSEHKDVGNGSMWIESMEDNSKISMRMDFGMGGTPYAHYIFEADGDNTKVIWTYDQDDLEGMGKMFSVMADGVLGPQYEQGLDNFKAYIEGLPDPEPEMEEEMMEGDSTMVEEVEEEAAE